MSTHLPNQNSWDQFWARDYRQGGNQKSWSKQRIEQVLLSCPAPRNIVLDAGCGSGYFSKMFCEWGWHVVALDYSQEALQVARCVTQNKVEAMQADLVKDDLSAKFPERNCSLIFSDGLFEHFGREDQNRILKNFYSVMEGGGRLVTVVPNRWSPWQIIRPLFMPGITEKPFVLSRLERLHKDNGFRIISSGGLNVLPFRFSPEFLGRYFGMLLYVIVEKQ